MDIDRDYSLLIALACDADRETRLPKIYSSLRKHLTIDDVNLVWQEYEPEGGRQCEALR